MGKSNIEWTEETWNPVTGCDSVSPGCDNCYAERLAARLQAMGNKRYINGFRVTLHWDKIGEPLRWMRPRLVFVNSMSDLFHPEVPDDFIDGVFDTMARGITAHFSGFNQASSKSGKTSKWHATTSAYMDGNKYRKRSIHLSSELLTYDKRLYKVSFLRTSARAPPLSRPKQYPMGNSRWRVRPRPPAHRD